MKTYLVVWFNSDGKPVSEITQRLMSMGFRPISGNYDYVYDWSADAPMEDVLAIGDSVQQTLYDCNVTFKLETV